MPCYLIERTFPDDLHIPLTEEDAAIRRAARRNDLPVDKISEVQVLDPYFYR
jgi:hypothetical protein